MIWPPSQVRDCEYESVKFRIPRMSPRADAVWYPFGLSAVIGDVVLPGGMVYVGTHLPTSFGQDPALINPNLPVAAAGDYTQRRFADLPAYSSISDSARRAYLNWHASGRRDPGAVIAYVFMFLYGLERRVLVDPCADAEARAELPGIAAELEDLLAVYGNNKQFSRLASKLVFWIALVTKQTLHQLRFVEYERGAELPPELALVLGECAREGIPVPANAALGWVRSDPWRELRTAALRCADQFDKLFVHRYSEQFDRGMMLNLRLTTTVKFVYTPASPGFRGSGPCSLDRSGIPDARHARTELQLLHKLASAVCDELDGFSRHIGRHAGTHETVEANLLLPSVLWQPTLIDGIQKLESMAKSAATVLSLNQLASALGGATAFTPKTFTPLVQELGRRCVGVEPPQFPGARPHGGHRVILFDAGEPVTYSSSADYPYALSVSRLTWAVSLALELPAASYGDEVLDQLRIELPTSERRRLHAQTAFLADPFSALASAKRSIRSIPLKNRLSVAKLIARLAPTPIGLVPAGLEVVQKVYRLLGVDEASVFIDLQSSGATAAVTLNKPALDTARIATLTADTARVGTLLKGILEGDDHDEGEEDCAPPAAAASGLNGLDRQHTDLLHRLLTRPSWSRRDLVDHAAELGLMLEGALERINDASFDVHEAPLTEGEDPITVDQQLFEKEPT